MIAYEPTEWHDLFVAIAGAAAALAGLLFVAVSINLAEILKFRLLTQRALETLGILVSAVIVSIFLLTPGQDTTVLGLELLITGVIGGGLLLWGRLRLGRTPDDPRSRRVYPVVGVILSFAPVAIAGFSLLLERGGGLYWLVPALILGLLVAVTNAWVLLVEVQR